MKKLLFLLFFIPSLAFAQTTPDTVRVEINQRIQPNGVGAITGFIMNGILNDMLDIMGNASYITVGTLPNSQLPLFAAGSLLGNSTVNPAVPTSIGLSPSFTLASSTLSLNPPTSSNLGGIFLANPLAGSFVTGIDSTGHAIYGSASAGLSTVYVSNTIANGLPVGNDSTGNGTSVAPYLTLDKALTVATAGQTILINDGIYRPNSGSYQPNVNLTINSINGNATAIKAFPGRTNIFNITTPGITLNFGNLVLDGDGTTQNLIFVNNSGANETFNLNGTILQNYTQYGFTESNNANFNLTATNTLCLGGVGRSCYYLPAHTSGALNWIDQRATVTNGDITFHNGSIVYVDADATGPTFSFTGNFNLTVNGGSNPAYVRAVQVQDVPNAVIGCGSINATATCGVINMSNLTANSECDGAFITNSTTAPIQADNGMIYGIAFSNNCHGGHGGAIIGFDGDQGTADNHTNHGRIFNNTFVIGPNSDPVNDFIEGGPFCGWETDCRAYRNSTVGSSYGGILKGCINCYMYSNLATNIAREVWLLKGGSGNFLYNNTSYETVPSADVIACINLEYDESMNGTTGNFVRNNICDMSSSTANNYRYVSGASNPSSPNSANFQHNNYRNVGGLVSGIEWAYNALTYSTLSAWQGAQEATATGVNPDFVNVAGDSVQLTGNTILVSGGIANGNVVSDFINNPFSSSPSIGAYQYLGPILNNITPILASFTVASLPTCSASIANMLAAVSDATSPAYNGALTGGGSVKIPVFCTGVAWTAH